MNLPLIVDPDGNVPLYQQLRYQFIYLIGSGQLMHGTQLPSIRELAKSLQINIGTVAQAYRELQAEGLIESVKGRGTFVRALPPPHYTKEATEKQEALTAMVTTMLQRAFSLGLTAGEIQQRIASLLSRGDWHCHLVFVGPTAEIARKHARILEESFGGDGVSVHPLDLAALQGGEVGEHFDLVHYVTTFTVMVQAVEEAIAAFPGDRSVLAVSTRVSDYTIGALATLPANTRACLISEEHNLHSAMNLVTNRSRLSEPPPTATHTDPERVVSLSTEADVVIHTFSSIALLDELGIPREKRLELRFDTDPDSIDHLRRLVRPLDSSLALVGT